MISGLSDIKSRIRVSYAARLIQCSDIVSLEPVPMHPEPGDAMLARVEKIGRNSTLELEDGRRCTIHEGNLLVAVFGNRYATMQFEGYAESRGSQCDLLSMGGLCGLMRSKHAKMPDPTRLSLIGAIANRDGPVNTRRLAPVPGRIKNRPSTIVVCGTSMDAGKTHTAASIVKGLTTAGEVVAAIKLTGTAAGKDTWNLLDAGARVALDFVDGGYPSTYMAGLDDLLALTDLLVGRAADAGATRVVIELADGLLQRETSALLQCRDFVSQVDGFVFAATGSLGAMGGVSLLRGWGIEPLAISGLLSMSPLAMREAEMATNVRCYTADELQRGVLNKALAPEPVELRIAPSDVLALTA